MEDNEIKILEDDCWKVDLEQIKIFLNNIESLPTEQCEYAREMLNYLPLVDIQLENKVTEMMVEYLSKAAEELTQDHPITINTTPANCAR